MSQVILQSLFQEDTVFAGCGGMMAAVMMTETARRYRLKRLLRKTLSQFELNSNSLFPKHLSLASDIWNTILSQSDRLKIIWAPSGTGKSTIIRQVLGDLQHEGQSCGALILSPPLSKDRSIFFVKKQFQNFFCVEKQFQQLFLWKKTVSKKILL